jgi:hypothetical protein
MRVYINKLNLAVLDDIQETLSNNLIKKEQFLQVVTDEGFYYVDNNKVQSLIPRDGEIDVLQNYLNDFTLIVDYSYFEKQNTNCIPGSKHSQQKITKYIYRLNHSNNKIYFIIENADIVSYHLGIVNSGRRKDCYFESNEKIDINELFLKQEIIEFLSLLT